MKEDDLLMQEALGNLDPGLLEESEKAMGKKRRPAPVRVLTVAACICALLVTAATAAEMAGVDVVETVRTMLGITVSEPETVEMFGEEWRGWSVTLPETFTDERFTEEFLAELQAALEDADEAEPIEKISLSGGRHVDVYDLIGVRKDFETLEELEEYLGTAPTINPVLEQGDVRRTEEYRDLKEVWHLIVHKMDTVDQDGVIDVCVYCNFAIPVPETEGELLSVFMDARFDTKENPNHGLYMPYVAEITQESYVTPNGLESVIARVRFDPVEEVPNSPRGATYAEFYLDGFRYTLTTYDYYDEAEVDEAKIETTLKAILDAYQ